MVAVSSSTSYSSYYTSQTTGVSTATTTSTAATTGSTSSAATSVTLSEAAQAAMNQKTLATVLAEARAKLTKILQDADRTSPLKDEKLAVDLSGLDSRELYAIAQDKTFTDDEREAAELEMQRRLETALSGATGVAEVTGDYTGLYKAAATYFDSLGPEEKDSTDWKAAREAITAGLKQLETNPKQLPTTDENDPVALYLALREAGGTQQQSLEDLAKAARKGLDQRYADLTAQGKVPSFNPYSTRGTYMDLSNMSSRGLSSIVLDKTGQFTTQEVNAAQSALRGKSSAVLMAGLKAAGQSTDPSAFSQNIISAFSSMSAEERQAAGWSDALYEAAVQNYQTSSKLGSLFNQLNASSTSNSASGSSGGGFSLASLLGG